MVVVGAVVAVINRTVLLLLALLCALLASSPLLAAVLPDNRIDLMQHSYQGGGVSIDGPALMLRSKIGNQVSVSGFYYVDTVSGASIDVVATASAYTETRIESRVGIEYLTGNSILSVNYAQSDENDYNAKSISFGIAHDTFGGMTTLSLNTSLGNDEVGRNGDESFSEQLRRYSYSLGITQVLSTRWISALNIEVDMEQGFLNNPYRSIRYRDPLAELGYAYQFEVYPSTRNTFALGLVNKFYLPYRAAITASLRHYQDSWDVQAFDAEIEYVHPLGERWVVDSHVRWYQQGQASFYRDLFDFASQQNFMARDKELSDFTNISLGIGASYRFARWSWWPAAKPELNLEWDHIRFNYNNFRDVTLADTDVGTEPLYRLTANVYRAFFSVYF
jgi:hypothetical protein